MTIYPKIHNDDHPYAAQLDKILHNIQNAETACTRSKEAIELMRHIAAEYRKVKGADDYVQSLKYAILGYQTSVMALTDVAQRSYTLYRELCLRAFNFTEVVLIGNQIALEIKNAIRQASEQVTQSHDLADEAFNKYIETNWNENCLGNRLSD